SRKLAEELANNFPELVSVYLYKSPRFHAKHTVLIVMRYINLAILDRLRPILKKHYSDQWKIQLRTREEFMSSGDIFPDFYLEMKTNYKVLVGKNDLKHVKIDDVHLRLFLEYDLRRLAFAFRKIILEKNQDMQILRKLAARTKREALRIFRYLMYLEGSLSGIAAPFEQLAVVVDKHPDFEEGLLRQLVRCSTQPENIMETLEFLLSVLMKLEAYTDKLRV
ncbi:MAG: hypothetical protein D6767_07760, partial [Candidatus Hydrogenedentota bacterium]